MNHPEDVAIDSKGNIYIADTANGRVREIVSGNISTIAGSKHYRLRPATAPPPPAPSLMAPYAVALDSKANVYIVENGDSRIREVTVSDGNINTIVGNGTPRLFRRRRGGAPTRSSISPPAWLSIPPAICISPTPRTCVIRKVSGSQHLHHRGQSHLRLLRR